MGIYRSRAPRGFSKNRFMTTLTLHLTFEYFDQIKAGTKTVEYPLCKPFWHKRLVGRTYDSIHIIRAYPRKGEAGKVVAFPYNGYTVETITHEHFGDDPVEVYVIPLRSE